MRSRTSPPSVAPVARRRSALFTAALLSMALTACGQKGPLVLPTPSKPASTPKALAPEPSAPAPTPTAPAPGGAASQPASTR